MMVDGFLEKLSFNQLEEAQKSLLTAIVCFDSTNSFSHLETLIERWKIVGELKRKEFKRIRESMRNV